MRRRQLIEPSGGDVNPPVTLNPRIEASYFIPSTGSRKVLGNSFDVTQVARILVDGVEQAASKNASFPSSGVHKVEFIPKGGTFTNLSYMFNLVDSVETIECFDGALDGVTSINSMIDNTYSLKSFVSGKVKGTNLKSMDMAFSPFSDVFTTADMKGWDLSGIVSASNVFGSCEYIRDIWLDGDGTAMGNHRYTLFGGIYHQYSIHIPKAKASSWSWLNDWSVKGNAAIVEY